MSRRLLITTSNGCYCLDEGRDEVRLIQEKIPGFWFFKKGGLGFFGIAYYQPENKVLFASRESLGTKKVGRKATDTKIYTWDPRTETSEIMAQVLDIHDIHQICTHKELLFLTDTGKNRVVVYNLVSKQRVRHINIGEIRKDIHHINTLTVIGTKLLVGLNNRGKEFAQILTLDLEQVLQEDKFEFFTNDKAQIHTLEGLYHTHDAQIWGDRELLVCSSFDGKVFKTNPLKELIHAGDWARGLCPDGDKLWVGASPIAERRERHREDLDGYVKLFSGFPFRLEKSVLLKGCGQVNDLLLID